ncbi:MAG: S-methyl-5-thioribose-1-phosphate isomerase [Deltaproteobacteria bacterium]|jgi:methylthioribose-1-phosphate isomerase|nr:S-methyl-5-thioribose-1-phosphate isomerase [Deltaproteobacteria bacterium]
MLNYHIRPEPGQKRLLLLDQRLLPGQEQYFICRNADDVTQAVQNMVVRGAPAIGVTAAWGCWLEAAHLEAEGLGESRFWEQLLDEALQKIAQARPTAVNLAWAVERMRKVWQKNTPLQLHALADIWRNEAENIHADDIELNIKLGAVGAELLTDGDTVMTHCNAGSLATAGYGTALGVVYAAVESGKKIRVIANETRPLLQGARLSAYELQKSGVEVTVACDNACALLMQKGLVQKVVTGADRIAADGDTANKIGTHGVAIMARHFGIPFYIAAPCSTFDFRATGDKIPLEERPADEVLRFNGTQISPAGVDAYNFAFDVTPAALISAFITERGIFKPPYGRSLNELRHQTEDKA